MAARDWAQQRKHQLQLGGEEGSSVQSDRLCKYLIKVLRDRASTMGTGNDTALDVLDRVWLEQIQTGYCSAEIKIIGSEYAVLLDSGLTVCIHTASRLVARHFTDGLFSAEEVTNDSRQAFARAFRAFIGQLPIYGRILNHLPDAPMGFTALANKISIEAILFVVAHEVAHGIAGHFEQGARTDRVHELHNYENEIEADALAAVLWCGDWWGNTLTQGEIQMRLLAVRTAFHILELTEKSALVPKQDRHLPAAVRWEVARKSLKEDLPNYIAQDLDEQWKTLQTALSFSVNVELSPPSTPLLRDYAGTGWAEQQSDETEIKNWVELELSTWQFELPPAVLYTLIGCEILFSDAPMTDIASAMVAGSAAAHSAYGCLPSWLLGKSSFSATTNSSDVIVYLRDRENWPEPFQSNDEISLPIHLMAAAIMHIANSVAFDDSIK